MKYRTLGRTGLRVSEVGFGAWAIGGGRHGNSYGPTDDTASLRAILRAVEMGCNFFDAADLYGHGHSEDLLGEALSDSPDVLIATKVGCNFYGNVAVMDFSPKYIAYACEQSLRRLRRKVIDLYQLHNPSLEVIRDGRAFDVLDEMKRAGRIRHYGVSVHTPEEAMACIQDGRPETVQVVYSMVNQSMAKEVFAAARAENVGVIAREPLANGFLSGKYNAASSFTEGDIRHHFPAQYREALTMAARYLKEGLATDGRTLAQAALRFVLDNEAVSVVIPGCKTADQARENMSASELSPLSAEETDVVLSLFR